MDGAKYKKNIINRVKFDMPGYLGQKLINSILEAKIGTYGKEKEGIIQLKHKSFEQKVDECISKNLATIKLIDLLEITKGYRYTILYKYNNLNISKLEEKATNVNSEYYKAFNDDAEIIEKPLYLENDKHICLKFHKEITIIDKVSLKRRFSRYPILLVFHKEINLLEVRFDKLGHEGDYDFYKVSMKPRLDWIASELDVKYEPFNTEKTIKYIVENKNDIVKQIIWSFEGAKSKGLTLKAGEDGVMPFIGELELMIEALRIKYSDQCSNLAAIDEIQEFLNKTKRFANERFRILNWIKIEDSGEYKDIEDGIWIKVNFRYDKSDIDLINIYENEINDMERIDYVIRFIGQSAKDIGEL